MPISDGDALDRIAEIIMAGDQVRDKPNNVWAGWMALALGGIRIAVAETGREVPD